MGWRSERRYRGEQRRAALRAEGYLVSRINLVGLGAILAVVVVAFAAPTEAPTWFVGIAAMVAAVPAAVGLRQLPSAYRQHRRARRSVAPRR